MNRYTAALTRELELVGHDLRPRTVFFGGGTPSILSIRQWEALLRAFERLSLLGASEWTVECNPATVSLDKAKLWRQYGINRVSMGVQSLDAALLEKLGRVHDRDMVFRSYEVFRKAGFENVNIDLMFAIPGQTMDVWRSTLREATQLQPEHLSCYEVIYEEDTELYRLLKANAFDVDEALASDMYDALIEEAESRGWNQYEIANFARTNNQSSTEFPTWACRHNLNYWRGGSFYGLGPSATGYVDGTRSKNWANTQLYCEQLEKGVRAIESRETLSPLARAGETAAFGLRLRAGWPFEAFQGVTGFDLRQDWLQDMEHLIQQGWAEKSSERFRLTRAGLRFADSAAERMLRTESPGQK